MTNHIADTIALEQLQEHLRQVRETFDQRKSQDAWWFKLRLAMGVMAVVLVPTFMLVCTWIIVNHTAFDQLVVVAASGGLFADILGMILSVWRISLGRGPEPLAPVVHPTSDSTPQFSVAAAQQSEEAKAAPGHEPMKRVP